MLYNFAIELKVLSGRVWPQMAKQGRLIQRHLSVHFGFMEI